MLRNILSLLSGLAAAVIIFVLGEQINASIYPFPKDLAFENTEALKAFYTNQPLTFWLLVLLVWALGSAVCGLLIRAISKTNKKTLPFVAGTILTIAGIFNISSLPHPMWFVVVGLLIFIPFVLLGFSLYRIKSSKAH